MSEKNPAISVIMPMYNMEKYIGECLDSLVAQTFKDFEVIIVDDCSTDKSCEIAESYASKLNLILIRSEKNSGGHVGVPRNKGIKIAKGDYIYFVDSDDALMENALEKFYNAAEEFQADVVHCDKTFQTTGKIDLTQKASLDLVMLKTGLDITEPILMNNDLKARLQIFFNHQFRWEPWNHIVRRDFMLEQGIKFPTLMSISDDMVFTLTLVLSAENIIVIPDGLYIWRNRETSNSVKKYSSEVEIKKVGGDIIHGINFIDNFCNERNILEDNYALKFYLFISLINFQIPRTAMLYENTPVSELDKVIRSEVKKVEDTTAITAFFFNYINLLKLQSDKLQKETESLNKENDKLRKFGMKMIELTNYHRVEAQNLKSVLDDAAVEEVFKFG